MIDCEKARELVGGYIDGMLDEAQAVEYEEHISCCEACHNEYDMLKKISIDLSQTVAPLPDGFVRRARKNFADEKSIRIINFPYYKVASAFAAVFVIAVVGKFGVYDIYQNVMNKNEMASNESIETRVSEPTVNIEPDEIPQTKTVISKDKSNNQKRAEKKTYIEPSPEEPANAVVQEYGMAEEAPAIANIMPESSEPASVQSVADTANIPTVASEPPTTESGAGGSAMSGARAIKGEQEDVAVSSDNTETSPEEAESVPEPATALVPAGVTLYKGDGSTEAFKKFLKTFLNSSSITETSDTITISVEESRYDSVMAKIRSNEYVKSVSDGTPFGGVAEIKITVNQSK